MKIVVDTNVLISGVFFGGFPRKVLSSIVETKKDYIQAATQAIRSAMSSWCPAYFFPANVTIS